MSKKICKTVVRVEYMNLEHTLIKHVMSCGHFLKTDVRQSFGIGSVLACGYCPPPGDSRSAQSGLLHEATPEDVRIVFRKITAHRRATRGAVGVPLILLASYGAERLSDVEPKNLRYLERACQRYYETVVAREDRGKSRRKECCEDRTCNYCPRCGTDLRGGLRRS